MNYLALLISLCLFALWIVGLVVGATHWLTWLDFAVACLALIVAFSKTTPVTPRTPVTTVRP